MFVDLDLNGSTVLLCGETARTTRVGQKFVEAGALIQVSAVDDLADTVAEITGGVSLVALCMPADAATVADWKSALKAAGVSAPVYVDQEQPPSRTGTVFLIGAGPGDPGLMTRHSLEALAASDLVLLDHLAPHSDLARWAPRARVIDVGKIPGKHRVPQHEIDTMMVHYARQGKNVARLKGGDPYVFGRGAEELYVCEKHGVPVQVFSGVTSSIALPAMAGVPLTLRGVSHMFTVVSGHLPLADSELDQLAGLLHDGGTVSILMGVKTLPHTVAGLRARGVPATMPLVTVENGFRQNQREIFSSLGSCLTDLADVQPPAVTTIGEVVAAVGGRREELMSEAFKTH